MKLCLLNETVTIARFDSDNSWGVGAGGGTAARSGEETAQGGVTLAFRDI
jgi:hypothetical protein